MYSSRLKIEKFEPKIKLNYRRCVASQSLGQAFSKACGFQRQRLWSAVATAEIPQSVLTSARGEFQNSPVDCFGRGDALSRASPRWAWAHAHAHPKSPKGGWAASFARRGRLPAAASRGASPEFQRYNF